MAWISLKLLSTSRSCKDWNSAVPDMHANICQQNLTTIFMCGSAAGCHLEMRAGLVSLIYVNIHPGETELPHEQAKPKAERKNKKNVTARCKHTSKRIHCAQQVPSSGPSIWTALSSGMAPGHGRSVGQAGGKSTAERKDVLNIGQLILSRSAVSTRLHSRVTCPDRTAPSLRLFPLQTSGFQGLC